MRSQPTLEKTNLNYFEWALYNALLYALFIGLFGPVTSAVAFYFERLMVRRMVYALALSASLVWLIVLANRLTFTEAQVMTLWLYSVPLFPLASLTLKGAYMFSRFSKPKTLHEKLAEDERRLQAEEERRRERASKLTEAELDQNYLRVGAQIKGEIFPEFLKIHQVNDWVYFDEDLLDQHLFILGASGSGKTEAIKRLTLEILKRTNRSIYFVDGKGDEQLANDIRSISHQHGHAAPVFRLGFTTYGAIYDGFRGGPETIYNRLLALIGVADMEGDSRYYADANRSILQYVCKAPPGPPRNFETVLERIDKEWLINAYQSDRVMQGRITRIDDELFKGLSIKLDNLVGSFEVCVGEEGFGLENTTCAIFSVRTQSVGDTARSFLDFLVEDFKDFIGNRQKHPGVLIIDEFGQFSNNNIIALLMLARSSKMGVILATQDTASFNDELTKKNVLANCRTKFLMASEYPEEVAELAGTRFQLESSVQYEEGDLTGMGSARVQHAYKIDMNEAAQLRTGEAFLIRQRYAAKVKFTMIDKVEQVKPQPEEKRERKQVEPQKRPPAPPIPIP